MIPSMPNFGKGVFLVIDISLKQAFEVFIFDRETFCSETTVTNYKNTIRYFCNFMEQLREQPADKIMCSTLIKQDLVAYSHWLRGKTLNEGHPFKKESGGKLSRRTVRNYCMDLKTFMHYLHQEDYIEDIHSGFKLIRAESKVPVPLSATEVDQLDECFNVKTATGNRNLCIVHLMLDAGLRSHEVRELEINRIFFDNRQILINGKGSKQRVVPMGAKLRKYLWMYFNLHRTYSEHGLFLTGSDGQPLTESAIKSMFSRVRKKAGIDRLTPHLLRHTFASCFIVGGGSVEMLRILLGHSSIETTQRYMHVATLYDYQENVYELDPIFFKSYSRIRR